MNTPLSWGTARFRLWLWTAACLAAIAYWSIRFGLQPFSEVPQIAVVGHDAPWRKNKQNQWVVAAGTDRRFNDITLYDRKASPLHLVLERQGSGQHWWAILHNRSADRAIDVRRQKSPQQRIQVNRYLLQDKDRFLVPVYTKNTVSLDRPQDACSPPQVHAWLQHRFPGDSTSSPLPQTTPSPATTSHANPTPPNPSSPDHSEEAIDTITYTKPSSWVAIEVYRSRLRVSLRQRDARMTWGTGQQQRLLWLDPTQRYNIPQQAGGGWLEYRYHQWQIFRQNRWSPLVQPLVWGSPSRRVELVRRPAVSLRPQYQIGLLQSPCRWTLQPQSIPAGLSMGNLAQLGFQNQRLVLQHLGRTSMPVQILPHGKRPLLLGTTRIFSGDYITIGQLTYQVFITQDRVRMMIAQLPQRYLFPLSFFHQSPSEHYPMRHELTARSSLLLTGGEGDSSTAQRWRIPLSLAGTPGKTRLHSPYSSFLLLQYLPQQQYRMTPLGDLALYRASPSGQLDKQSSRQAQTVKTGTTLYYIQRLYFRVFQPSYGSLFIKIGLLWLLLAGGSILFLHRLLAQGTLAMTPFLSQPTPHTMLMRSPARWFAGLSLLPVALFLNGLGLYVLAHLSMSSLGLNHASFLYRQLLWSLVGVFLFVAVTAGIEKLWTPTRTRLAHLIPSWLQNYWQRLFPPSPPKVQLLQPMQTVPWNPWRIGWITALYLVLGLVLAMVFQSWSLLLPMFVLYGYVWLFWREYRRHRWDPVRKTMYRFFFITLLLLGTVPLLGLLIPPLVHNRFFLMIPGLGTVKLSEFAILSAIVFFAHYLGLEIFGIQRVQMLRNSQSAEVQQEASLRQHRRERLWGAIKMGGLYLLLLGSIGVLYTLQGDLGPGLILTLCFSLFLLFSFLTTGADRLTTVGNLLRIATVFVGFLLFLWLPDLVAWLFPEWSAQSSELQKVRERLALWNQPWRFLVGEQILQNIWNLAAYRDVFQWFSNLHSDFVMTAVVRVLSPIWGYTVILVTCWFPLATLLTARNYWTLPTPTDSLTQLHRHQQNLFRALFILFAGIYLFAQNVVHIGSVLRLTPMTGVTLTWISSGGTSLIVCYLILAMIHRQFWTSPEPST